MPTTPPLSPVIGDMDELKRNPIIVDLVEQNKGLRDQLNRMEELMQRFIAVSTAPLPSTMTPAARALATTPASRSSIGVVRDVDPRPPTARSLSFRPPEVAPIAPSSTLATSLNEADSPPPSNSQHHFPGLKVNVPTPFSGTTRERATAKLWLESVITWMELTASGRSERTLILLFSNVLKDGALLWYHNLRNRAESEGKVLTLQNYFDDFVKTYEGALSQLTAQQQLKSLVYKKDPCKDLTATDNKFDKLAMRLYPSAQASEAAISLLAGMYSDTIRRGDIELWEKAMDATPSTLDDWKVAVQNAFLVLETKKAHRGERVDRQEVRTTYYSRPSTSTSTSAYRGDSTVQVKRVGVEGNDNDGVTRDEPGNEEEVQQAEVSRTSSRPAFHERLGSHLTFQQRERLKELGKCWICIGKGHRAYDCEKKGKVGYPRKPTAEDLKA